MADIGTKTLPKTVLYSLMYQLNMIDGKEAEDFVSRLDEHPRVKGIKIKEVEVEGGVIGMMIVAFLLAIVLSGCRYIKEVFKLKEKEAVECWKWINGPPTWENEVLERLNQQADRVLELTRKREDEETQEVEKDVASMRKARDERTVRVRTLKVQVKQREERFELEKFPTTGFRKESQVSRKDKKF